MSTFTNGGRIAKTGHRAPGTGFREWRGTASHNEAGAVVPEPGPLSPEPGKVGGMRSVSIHI